ncbi:MAG TPA: hypothetical protein VLA56_06065 [Pseudomonadales bacterium]|nr:hypothetical protein [Pseudomonadales bacterium]
MATYRIAIVALSLGLLPPGVAATDGATAPQSNASSSVKRAVFARVRASRDVRELADWVVDSDDSAGLPFVIVDKANAHVFVFDAAGRILGAAPALLGVARGDHTVSGIGDREYSDMPPETRTTPAGRFVATRGMSTRGEDVVWVDYDAGVSLHRVVTTRPEERRLERLATPTPLDNRISYGCINVPARFYETVVSPTFAGGDGIVYVLPETRPARELFGARAAAVRPLLSRAGSGTSPATARASPGNRD